MPEFVKCAVWVPSAPRPHFCNKRNDLTKCDDCNKIYCKFHQKRHKEF